MSFPRRIRGFSERRPLLFATVVAAVAGGAGGVVIGLWQVGQFGWTRAARAETEAPETRGQPDANLVELSASQAEAVKVAPVAERSFPDERTAVGAIAFDDDQQTQVFTPYQGRIIRAFAEEGDDVAKGQTLFTVESPDLIQAESTLIAAAGVLDLTNRALVRARELYRLQGMAQKDLEQAVSDQQTAEGALKAAKDAVRVFGKTETEVNAIAANRRVDPVLIVPSPIAGRVTARSAAPGLLVQPGNAPAPFTVADISTVWMQAFVTETESPRFHVGQAEAVSVSAYPGRIFEGRITALGTNIDSVTRRLTTRSEVRDPDHLLRPGMFATFVIQVGPPETGPAVPANGIVREGDGTMTLWVTSDRRRFTRRTVTLGRLRDGYYQVLTGIRAGEMVATDGALFLDNTLAAATS